MVTRNKVKGCNRFGNQRGEKGVVMEDKRCLYVYVDSRPSI